MPSEALFGRMVILILIVNRSFAVIPKRANRLQQIREWH